MKTFEELKEYLQVFSLENSMYLSEEETVRAIVGHDDASGALIYDYDKLVEAFMVHFNNGKEITEEDDTEELYTEAADWVSFNTIRSLPYHNSDYIAYDKDGNEVNRFDAYRENAKETAEKAAGEGGRAEYVEYVNPIIMHSVDDFWND